MKKKHFSKVLKDRLSENKSMFYCGQNTFVLSDPPQQNVKSLQGHTAYANIKSPSLYRNGNLTHFL